MVSVLLMLTILYCVRLNKQIRLLKADEQSLRATIGELITATEIADRPLGDFSGGDQLADGRAQRLFVGLEQPDLLIKPNAIKNGEHKQHRHHAFDQIAVVIIHGASFGNPDSSAPSNMAKVVLGLRNDLPTRTATRSPTFPMRPSVSETSPQRTVTGASGLRSSISVSPILSAIMRRSGSRFSYSTASTSICACPISVARWPSQIGSRPNFSPMNIWSRTARIGSMVALSKNNS